MTAVAYIPRLANPQGLVRDFALWSQAYDSSPNPMLSLEERFLSPLLPALHGEDVLDIGCGTGRWLQRLESAGARSLTGIDFSAEMLARAHQKMQGRARLAAGSATSLPVANSSADVVLASFVASYVSDLTAFARELRRTVRPAGSVFISDVHPETAAACHWKRSFRAEQQEILLRTRAYSLSELMECLRDAGFQIASLLEPCFGGCEFETLRRAGKLDAFYASEGLPAIYILQLVPHQPCVGVFDTPDLSVRASAVALDADAATRATLEIRDGTITRIASRTLSPVPNAAAHGLFLNGYMLLPGLINAHDHLEFGLYPNLGRGPYANAAQWARDIHQRDAGTIAAHQSIPRDVRVWWGAIRNLLCGVTTVCHHNRVHSELLAGDFAIRVLTNFGWAHSLAMDEPLTTKYRDTPAGDPFVLHACEGVDEGSADEIFELDRRGILDERSILVHGLALGNDGVKTLNRCGAALVLCPSSNRFLFGRTLTPGTIANVERLMLGSDSPLTAAGDLLDELRIAHHELGIPSRELYSMLLRRAADIFRLRDGAGTLRAGASADFIAVRERGLTPADTLVNLNWTDVELVVVRGRVQLASEALYRRLPAQLATDLHSVEVNDVVRWVRAPLPRMFREAQRVLGDDVKVGGKRVRHVAAT